LALIVRDRGKGRQLLMGMFYLGVCFRWMT
jgi:hypothetical protein